MKLIAGNEGDGIAFLRGIGKSDKVAAFSHIDTDGFVSGFLMDKAISPMKIYFFDYSTDLIKNVVEIVQEQDIKKVVFTDLNLEQNLEDLKKLSNVCDVMIVDHHQYSEDINSKNLVFLRTDSGTCAALATYDLLLQIPEFRERIQHYDWLAAAAVIADYTFEQHREFVQNAEKKYNIKVKAENQVQAYSSDFGIIATLINNAAIYFYKDKMKFYEIFKRVEDIGDIKIIEKYARGVQKEIARAIEDFEKHCERKKDVMFYASKLHYPVTSSVTSILSGKYKNKTIIFVAESAARGDVKISSRRQDGKVNLPELLQKATQGLRDATTGGHFKAAGGSIRKEDIEKFKKKLMELV
jgi:single-stranded DNA-specific DHH superfamily exonuclease